MNASSNAAVISYSYFSRDARVRRYTEALREYGCKVDILAFKEDILPTRSFSYILFPFKRRRLGAWWYFVEYILFFLFALFHLSINAIKKRYRVIHVFNLPDILIFSVVVPKLLGAKIIFDIRDLSPELYQTKYRVSERAIMVRILSFIEKYSLFFSDVILTANPLFLSLVNQKYPAIGKRINIAYECADSRIFYPSIRKKENDTVDLLYIGTVEKRFAIDVIIQSMPQVIKKIPGCRLTIIPKISDEGSYFKKIKNLIQDYKLNKYVEILLPIPLEKVADEIRKADIGLVLAEKDPYTDIIYRTKLYEFVACKVPLIVTKTQFLAQTFTEKQLCFLDSDTPVELAKVIIWLSKNNKLRKLLADDAYTYYKEYNWEKEKVKYYQLLKELNCRI